MLSIGYLGFGDTGGRPKVCAGNRKFLGEALSKNGTWV